MFRKKSKKSTTTLSEQEKDPQQTAPPQRVKLSEEILSTSYHAAKRFNITDVDFTDADKPRLQVDGNWKDLERYTTTVRIELTDVTFEGHWTGGVYRSPDGRWFEELIAYTRIWQGRRDPVLMFFESSDEQVERGYEKFSFHIAGYETRVYGDAEFGELDHIMMDDNREEFFKGSPAKLFASAQDAREFIDSELMAYSEHRWPTDKPLPERERLYCWPEVVQGGDEYKHYLDGPEGFVGSYIRLPVDVFEGVRRAVADFKEGAVVELSVDTELFGTDVSHYPYTDSSSSAGISILPRSMQMTGKIKGINVKWDPDIRPFNNPGHWFEGDR
ncbi:MAG: hypothetical protein NXH72_08940 [Hyphomonadaceae bacterium]|nr:hypothetical protein [Hyphomonadaceae bacterium]